MKIGVRLADKTLFIDDTEYRFTELLMSKTDPVWKVQLENGGLLILHFDKAEKKCTIYEGLDEVLRE